MWKIVKGETVERFAEQLAVVPPPVPAQLQVHGPLPLTAEGVPTAHRLVVGAEVRVWPFDEPQTPFTGPVPTAVVPEISRSFTAVLAVSNTYQVPVEPEPP